MDTVGKVIALLTAAVFLWAAADVPWSDAQPSPTSVTVLYPRHNALAGRRVNVVLDPAADWTAIPFFQIVVGRREYPPVETSGGRHALQGVELEPGMNTITLRLMARKSGRGRDAPGNAGSYQVLSTSSLTVFNREGSFSGTPAGFAPGYFHLPRQEADCAGCHRLEVEQQDYRHARADDVLCSGCHRDIPSGEYIHGPAAVWDCLACHDPGTVPAKYQFGAADPWKVSKSVQPVEPAVFSISAGVLFSGRTATLIAESTSSRGGADKETAAARERQRALFDDVLTYIKNNPGYKVRIEAHVDDGRDTEKVVTNPDALTEARARAVAGILQEYGVSENNPLAAVGMGTRLPKGSMATAEGREINNRIEIVVFPPDLNVQNSMAIPSSRDRERVVIELGYARGPHLRGVKIIETVPRGVQYLKGSGVVNGVPQEPVARGNELIWQLGARGADFHVVLLFMVKRDREGGALLPPAVKVAYAAGNKEETREFDPAKPAAAGRTVQQTCRTCHGDITGAPFKHGPADAGYCTLCHDPHASPYPSWLRKQPWELCTTCHAEKTISVHVVAGFVRDFTHPMRGRRDPMRPGKQLHCASCHAPHSAETRELLAYKVRNKFELCAVCHRKR